jgi:hypothetical protein
LTITEIPYKVEIVDNNINELIDVFDKGYPYDEENLKYIITHSLRLRLYIYIARKRKATLQIEMVSSNALMANFWFYGDHCDEPAWDQIGVKEEEFEVFTGFLKELYSVYEYKIGGIAIEQDVLELFGYDETYPNECYRYENLSPDLFLKEPSNFVNIIWNENYNKLIHIPYKYKKLPKKGILIETGSFRDYT